MTQAICGISLDQRVVSLVRRAKAAATGRLQEYLISLMQHKGRFGREQFWLLGRPLPREQPFGCLARLAAV